MCLHAQVEVNMKKEQDQRDAAPREDETRSNQVIEILYM